eukprot:c14150_g1_i1 orf=290-655(+)
MGAFLSQQVRRVCQMHKSVTKLDTLDLISDHDASNKSIQVQTCVVCSCEDGSVPCKLKLLPSQLKNHDGLNNGACEGNMNGRILEPHEIDMRADAFIARFREHIKLERKESEKRYLEMLGS